VVAGGEKEVKGDGGERGEGGKGIDEVIQREKNSKRGRGKEKRRKRERSPLHPPHHIISHLVTSHLAISPSRHLAISPPLRRSLKPPHLCPRPRQVHAGAVTWIYNEFSCLARVRIRKAKVPGSKGLGDGGRQGEEGGEERWW
jgi:hypothetical protein